MAMVGMVLLAGCGQNIAEPVEEIVVATVTPTATATPFPTHTPTATPEPTSAPTATGTPLPPPTPLPEVVLEVSGPEIVPAGLPQAVEWSISVIDGAELVIVSIDDLGGVMLSGDDADQLDLVKTLVPANTANVAQSFDSVWIISGVIDPNIGQGVLTLLMETGLYQEVVTLPWVSSAVEEVEYRTYAIPLDGLNQEPVLNVDSESEVSRPGFNRYETINGLQFEHPQAWVINEFQDGIVQLSPDPLAAADGASLQDVPYATLIAGDRAAVGIPLTVDLDPESIIDWLLGDVTPVGGEQAGLFLSDELEVVRRGSLDLGDNSSTGDVILKPVQGEDAAEARYIVSVKSDDRLVILSAFDPEGNFFVELDEVISSLEFK